MAKYRITSLPQSLPKAQKGLFNKRNKISVKNGEVKLSPRLFGNDGADLTNVPQPSYWNMMESDVTAGEKCPPGKYSYNGECLTESEYVAAATADMNKMNQEYDEKRAARDKMFQEEIETQRKENKEEADRFYQDDITRYYENFDKSKKTDKIQPFQSIPIKDITRKIDVLDEQGNPVLGEDGKPLQESLEDQLKNAFLINKNKNGYAELFPKDLVYKKIVNNGFQAEQFKNYWGLDPKQVEEQLGSVMKSADDMYSAQMQQQIFNKASQEGISIDEAAKKLSGDKRGNLKKFIQPTKDLLNAQIEQMKAMADEKVPEQLQSMYYDNRNPNQGYSPKIDYSGENPAAAYNLDYYNTTGNWGQFLKDYSDYNKELNPLFNNDAAYAFYNKGNQKNENINIPLSDRTGDLNNQLQQINQDLLLGNKADAGARLEREAASKTIYKNFYDQLGNEISDAGAPFINTLIKEKLDAAKDNPKAFLDLQSALQNGKLITNEELEGVNQDALNMLKKQNVQYEESAPLMYDTSDKELTTSEKVFDVLTNPFDAFKASNQGGLSNLWDKSGRSLNERKLLEQAYSGSDYGADKNNLVGDVLNTWNPMRFARDVDADIDRGDYASAGLEGLAFAGPAIFNNAAKGARFATDANKLLSLNRVAPGTRGFIQSGFKAMNPYFGYEALRPGGNFNKAYDAFREGNIGEGLKEGTFGVLGVSPFIKPFKQLNDLTRSTSPYISNQISFNKGGYLPKAQPGGGLIKKAVDLGSSASSIISSLRNLPSTFNAISEGGNLFQNLWTNPINSALMNSAYESLAEGLYKNQSIQPLTDMLGSISNTDAKYLLTDALNQTDNPYEDLSNLMSNVDVDYSNIGDFNRNTLDFANRRGHAQKLLDLGYVGDEVTPLDLYKMARTNDSMNAITRKAIDFDRTGYRQVKGQLTPIGNLQDGYGPRGQFQYDMRKRSSGAPRSEFENMDLRGVDKSNPLSIAEYQATTIPMEQYGYRAGVPDMSQQDALYLTSLPTRQSYGPYQFKIKQDLDLSGNWKDWMQKYVYDKPTLHLNANRENDLSKIYFNVGAAKGVQGYPTDPATNMARGTGLHTRQWISGKGNQIGSIDPTFRFTDLKNMSAEDYLEMEREQEGLIKLFNTGWRGEYKNGGMPMKLSKSEINKYIKDGYIIEDE